MKKTIIITGSTGNLGNAVTKTFLDKGYTIIATITNASAEKDLPRHDNVRAEVVDLANEKATELFIRQTIEKYGKIDAALMLVGGFVSGNIAETNGADIRNQIALNFETAYNVTRPLIAHMIDNQNGRLVFIGARPALRANDGKDLIAYALSKSLIFNLADYINAEVGGKNIGAIVIVPSTLDTLQNRKSMPEADPQKWVKPSELAEIIEFVCSDAANGLRESIVKVYNDS